MLKSFHIVNYKSILNTQIPLTYMEKKAPNGYKEWESIPFFDSCKERLIPVLVSFGANASGKSNLLSAVALYLHILREGIREKFFPNKLNVAYQWTMFEIEVLIGRDSYSHLIKYGENGILYERLIKNNTILFEIKDLRFKQQSIADKGYNIPEFQDILKVECAENNLQIHPFLTKLYQRLPGLNAGISGMYRKLLENTFVFTPIHPPSLSLVLDIFKKLGVSYQEAFAQFTPILQALDVNISRLELIQEEKVAPALMPMNAFGSMAWHKDNTTNMFKQRFDKVISYHRDITGKEIPFEFYAEESDGTKRLLSIIGTFLLTLKTGGLLVWDELDNSLHPMLLKELLKIFKSTRYNKTHAQLIASFHNPYVLEDEDLRVSDVAIVNNTLAKGTTLTRIVDFEKSRNDTNFRKQYLNGHFMGIPNSCL